MVELDRLWSTARSVDVESASGCVRAADEVGAIDVGLNRGQGGGEGDVACVVSHCDERVCIW